MAKVVESVRFALGDRHGRLTSVRLQQEVGLPEPLNLVRSAGVWRLVVPRPDVDRMEYLFEIEDVNGHRSTILDPANPRRVRGVFGDKSVVEFDGYRAPSWLHVQPVAATARRVVVPSAELGSHVMVTLWSPAGLGVAQSAPLVVVHDGPEYAVLGGLTHYLGAMVATGAVPPMRAALVDPGDRNDWYAANSVYARALTDDVLPALAPLATVRIGMGASLGALALLHAHRGGAQFDALLLQSGSFFTREFDPQESGFGGFSAITSFVRSVARAHADPHPVPVVLTCGTVEENLANNRAMTRQLSRLGYPAELIVVRDGHNFTAWRDALHPHLARLITSAAGVRAA